MLSFSLVELFVPELAISGNFALLDVHRSPFVIVKGALSYKERKMKSVIKGLCYRSINRESSRPNIEISAIPSIII